MKSKCPFCNDEISEKDLSTLQESLKSYLEEEIGSLDDQIGEIRKRTDDWFLAYPDFVEIVGKIITDSKEAFIRLGREHDELQSENEALTERVNELSSALLAIRDELKEAMRRRIAIEKKAKSLKKA
jgi:chromosome segregation ATPase